MRAKPLQPFPRFKQIVEGNDQIVMGETSEEARIIQFMFRLLNYIYEDEGISSTMDEKMKRAVRNFQFESELPETITIDSRTLQELDNRMAAKIFEPIHEFTLDDKVRINKLPIEAPLNASTIINKIFIHGPNFREKKNRLLAAHPNIFEDIWTEKSKVWVAFEDYAKAYQWWSAN